MLLLGVYVLPEISEGQHVQTQRRLSRPSQLLLCLAGPIGREFFCDAAQVFACACMHYMLILHLMFAVPDM